MDDKIYISVLGCCVSRDTLELAKNKFNVERYVAFISPFTMLSGKHFDVPDNLLEKQGAPRFADRVLRLDANKSALDYLAEVKSDWLLLDIADARMGVVCWNKSGIYLTNNEYAKRYIDSIADVIGDEDYEKLESWELPHDLLIERFINIINQLLSVYEPHQIIFNKFSNVFDYISAKGTLNRFFKDVNKYKSWNIILNELSDISLKLLKGCHVIEAPDNLISAEKHKWGLSPLHYHQLYYEYAEKAISIITQKYDRAMEDEKLEQLRRLYSEKFATLREKALNKSLRLDRDKWQNYSYSFKTLIQNKQLFFDENFNLQLQNCFLLKGYKHIAIYGDTEITKVLCAVLKGSGVSIDYIVENASNPVPGFKTINRNATEYLDCDVMLVADIYNFKDIKAKLEKMKVPFPFYNAAEFIQSLPAADGDGIDKIKEKIRNLNDRIVFEREEKERLDIQLSTSTKREAELAEKVGTLTKRDTLSQEKIKSLSVDIKQLTATNRRVAEERDGCMGELESLKNSLSFRLGRAITFIPRKIRDAFKKSKK